MWRKLDAVQQQQREYLLGLSALAEAAVALPVGVELHIIKISAEHMGVKLDYLAVQDSGCRPTQAPPARIH